MVKKQEYATGFTAFKISSPASKTTGQGDRRSWFLVPWSVLFM